MRWLVLCLVLLGLTTSAMAVDLSNRQILPPKGEQGDQMSDGREGGESYADALLIPGLPYADTGATCDNRDDTTPACGYSMANDVVYKFVPTEDAFMSVYLCGSGYDTILEIQDGIGIPVACNDDFCGLQSGIEFFPVVTGHEYYIIVDGYSNDCGSYILEIALEEECVFECPPGAILEGEPDCHDDYVDTYNGGCNSDPEVFQLICPTSGNQTILCGTSGTYLFEGSGYRDTDWLQVYGTGGLMSASCIAEFPVQLLFIHGTDCIEPEYDAIRADRCEFVIVGRNVDLGELVWVWVGPSVFSGVPCGADYVLTLDGIYAGPGCQPTPAREDSWGRIKGMFR
ncbi:MAG: hypothetical protein KAY32_08170 [Candidatus Eisenbacteria sp.]|nr:hypothetical protein [Candidatus Eisenbacteria bacterium]